VRDSKTQFWRNLGAKLENRKTIMSSVRNSQSQLSVGVSQLPVPPTFLNHAVAFITDATIYNTAMIDSHADSMTS